MMPICNLTVSKIGIHHEILYHSPLNTHEKYENLKKHCRPLSACDSVAAQCQVYWFGKVQRHNSFIG